MPRKKKIDQVDNSLYGKEKKTNATKMKKRSTTQRKCSLKINQISAKNPEVRGKNIKIINTLWYMRFQTVFIFSSC